MRISQGRWLGINQSDGENVDMDALIEALAARHGGRKLWDQLFAKLRKEERDIAVMCMVDMTGSIKGRINDVEREAPVRSARRCKLWATVKGFRVRPASAGSFTG